EDLELSWAIAEVIVAMERQVGDREITLHDNHRHTGIEAGTRGKEDIVVDMDRRRCLRRVIVIVGVKSYRGSNIVVVVARVGKAVVAHVERVAINVDVGSRPILEK